MVRSPSSREIKTTATFFLHLEQSVGCIVTSMRQQALFLIFHASPGGCAVHHRKNDSALKGVLVVKKCRMWVWATVSVSKEMPRRRAIQMARNASTTP